MPTVLFVVAFLVPNIPARSRWCCSLAAGCCWNSSTGCDASQPAAVDCDLQRPEPHHTPESRMHLRTRDWNCFCALVRLRGFCLARRSASYSEHRRCKQHASLQIELTLVSVLAQIILPGCTGEAEPCCSAAQLDSCSQKAVSRTRPCFESA